jgi:hypothetical protein
VSEPKRYTPDYTFTGTAFVPTTREVSEGEYVRYEDYARLKAEVERLTKENETINKDRALLWASHKIALQDIQGLHYALQTAKEGKSRP